jgi:hypothetical protein
MRPFPARNIAAAGDLTAGSLRIDVLRLLVATSRSRFENVAVGIELPTLSQFCADDLDQKLADDVRLARPKATGRLNPFKCGNPATLLLLRYHRSIPGNIR